MSDKFQDYILNPEIQFFLQDHQSFYASSIQRVKDILPKFIMTRRFITFDLRNWFYEKFKTSIILHHSSSKASIIKYYINIIFWY